MVNLRREFKNILREFGDKAIMLSSEDSQRCTCVDSLTLSARPECPYCLGSGLLMQAHALYCRSSQSSTSDILPKNLTQSAVGPLPVGQRQWFLEYDESARRFNYLIFCSWRDGQPVLDRSATVYKILNVEPMIGDHGRIEYLEVLSQSDPINARIKLTQLGQQFGPYLAISEDNI